MKLQLVKLKNFKKEKLEVIQNIAVDKFKQKIEKGKARFSFNFLA